VNRVYSEGAWFAVPLRDRGFAVGVVARSMPHREGVILGYFYGPRRRRVPDLAELKGLTHSAPVLVERFGDLGLVSGDWPLIGRFGQWSRNSWPLPAFGRYEELTGRAFEVVYDENDPNKVVSEKLIDKAGLAALPPDRLAGSGAIEIRLSRRLR
jgi:hypothetical protein